MELIQLYTVLEWVMTRLLRHPRVLKKVQNEIMGIANSKPDIAEIDLDQMHNLNAVIKETLRLYPPIPLLAPRESTKDVKIKGYDIAARTMVLVNAWTIGRDPSLWDEPERFLNSAVDFEGHDFRLIPFGAGRRGCQGQMFAMTTIELVLANLVRKFDWALPCGERAEDMNNDRMHRSCQPQTSSSSCCAQAWAFLEFLCFPFLFILWLGL